MWLELKGMSLSVLATRHAHRLTRKSISRVSALKHYLRTMSSSMTIGLMESVQLFVYLWQIRSTVPLEDF